MFSRAFQGKFQSLLKNFRCVSLIGARQVGKSFFLKDFCRQAQGVYVTLDDPLVRASLEADPLHWIYAHRKKGYPFVIDEAAKYPEIFNAVKVIVDEEDPVPTQIILASSSNYLLLRNIKETLAGRVGLLSVYPLSWMEVNGGTQSRMQDLLHGRNLIQKSFSAPEYSRQRQEMLLCGGFPEVQTKREDWDFVRQWASQYFSTYILPLAVELFHITKQHSFEQVFRQLALRSAQLLNYADIANPAKISSVTVKSHVHYLETMMVCRTLYQHFYNPIKRLVKSPKVHMADSLFINANFGMPNDLATIARSGLDGALYESFVYSEIVKALEYESLHYELNTWHTADQAEVDLVLTQGTRHIPIEIKFKEKLSGRDLSGLKSWLAVNDSATDIAYVIYAGNKIEQLHPKIWAVPDFYAFGLGNL